MATVMLTTPLGEPSQYDPSFKVEVCLHEPLWSDSAGDSQFQILALSAQLDLLFKKELLEQPSYSVENGKTSNSFRNKAMLLRERLEAAFASLPAARSSTGLLDYLDCSGVSRLYPRAAAFIADPDQVTFSLKKTRMDGYFSAVAGFHQVLILARQIHNDVSTSSNHKYIAHQVALLFQALANLKEDTGPLTDLRKGIEKNFKHLKDTISKMEDEGHDTPQLQKHERQWLLDTTSEIDNVITAFSCDVTNEMERPAHVIAQFS